MDRPSSAARRRTFDLPSKPETGLAEWTSKIKELQRQVDQDEETEHKRLEEEIRASRMARLRRSGQIGSVDLSKSDLSSVASSPAPDSPASPAGRQQGQEDALRRLTGEARPSTTEPVKSVSSKAPMSLAEFMGGRATGPRLTRHAPQQDAHDPTQFEQRTLRNITTPHPVFGRGGVAMPGMTGRNRTPAPSTPEPEERARLASVANHITGRDRKQSTPSVVQSIVHKVEVETVAPQKTGASTASSYTMRQRTISTPTGSAPLISAPPTRTWETTVQHNNGATSRPVSISPGLRSATPGQDRHTPARPIQTPPPVSSSSISRPSSSSRSPAPTSPTTSSSPKATISTPSLARPIQPSPRASLGPQLPISLNPSPAFLRAPPPKDPTPSISRLQGRGFVKSMVQATAQLSVVAPPTPPLPEKKDSGGRKSAPVLDRWQNTGTTSSTPSPPPIISPRPAAMRKSWTVDPSSPDTTPPRSVKTDYTGRSLKSVSSVPSFHHSDAASSSARSDAGDGSPRGRGLGSSTTMISYIKPIKTGDRPMTASPPPPEVVDEMGVRVRTRSKSQHRSRSRHRSKSREAPREEREGGGASAGLPPAGKPLSHLTKDRAKKPRKARFAQDPVQETRVVSSSAASAEVKQTSQPEPAPLSHLISTAPAPEVVVSLPSSDHAPTSQQEQKPVSPLKSRFEDDFVPSASPPVANKPSQLSQLVMPKSLVAPTQSIASPVTPNRGLTPSPTSQQAKEKPPASPGRHTRIPSTGNRALVMDVAQALAVQTALEQRQPREEQEAEVPPPPDVKIVAANWGPRNGTARADADKRKSSYERYSAIMMPPLEEEKTPTPSPAGTLARSSVPVVPDVIPETEQEVAPPAVEGPAESSASLAEVVSEPAAPAESKIIHIESVDEPLPNIDVAALLNSGCSPYSPDADVQTISVDVMIIVGNVATAIPRDTYIFYDHDVLAIIHRAKVRSTGLVSTKVWGWKGKHGRLGEREEQKLQGLARQYGTKMVRIQQYCEPTELVAVLGGKLAIRQGSRSHWSPENTAMHLVRSLNGVTFIDEVDIGIRNLCSAFSYCLSLLGSLYVWHGCGSADAERAAACEYARALASSASVIELVEGESDADDEMFWLILGDGEYAKADYWKWKASSPSVHPRIWSVDATKGDDAIQPVPAFADHPEFHHLVHLVDCVWEFFVVVGSEARGKRRDIKLALAVATKLSDITASSRPFTPTVHALILPSQLPTDLRLHFRDLDEAAVNAGHIPEHMNLLAAGDAEEHLKTTTWERAITKDPSMLPLGVHVSDLR
ncbi:uncharacterized protein B0H18DRAFT_908993 [Fomitopsis serialis]|uniref:uncharacterized protein n=1 Tax=Fomitopsis serialis TaxID=139415 RepID=UPI002008C3FC|nr:uncharacterized protein B0H18DRAFT_908993 [Neoantrodia serialis]KAH9924883.1 hypothetical protein B0H18DRAFT_908993 [Neoantrodia serialis]